MADDSRMKLRKQLFGTRMSISYHRSRQGFFDFWATIFKLVSVASATAVFAAVFASWDPKYALWASAIVGAMHVVDLVIDPAKRARKHSELAVAFLALEQRIDSALLARTDGPDVAAELTSERLRIEASEPPALLWLSLRSRNDIITAQKGRDAAEIVHIPFPQRLLIQIIDFWPYTKTSQGG